MNTQKVKGEEVSNYFTIDGHITEKIIIDYNKESNLLTKSDIDYLLCHTSDCDQCSKLIRKMMCNKVREIIAKKENDEVLYAIMKSKEKCKVITKYVYDFVNNSISVEAVDLFRKHIASCHKCKNLVENTNNDMKIIESNLISANGQMCQLVAEQIVNYRNKWLSKVAFRLVDEHLLTCIKCNNEILRNDEKYNKRFAVGGVEMLID